MLKANQDLTLRYDGKTIEVKKGDVINVRKVFGVRDNEVPFLERRFIDKFGKAIEKVVKTPISAKK